MLIDKIKVLVFGAHPDDAELGLGATIAQLTSKGNKVVVIDLTEGELSTRGDIYTRYQESKRAAKILGIYKRINLKMSDGFFLNCKNNILKIVYYIRKFQPEIIFTTPPKDRHPDHIKANKIVTDAVFFSGLNKIHTYDKNILQKEWKINNLYYYILWDNLKPNFIIDVSGFENKKIQSCMIYKSQFYNKNSKENNTKISSKNFKNSISYRMKDWGRLIDVEYGEAFLSNRIIAIKNIFNLY